MAEETVENQLIPKLDFKEIIGLNVRLLQIFGNVIPEFSTKTQSFLYFIYATSFVGIIYVGMLTSEVINMLTVITDLEKMTEGSFLTLTHLIQLSKLYAIYMYRKKLKLLINTIDREAFRPKTIRQYNTLKRYVQDSKVITKTFLVACIITCAFWSVYPFTVDGDLSLPLAGWYPFDTTTSPAFEIAFGYQVVASTINGLSNISLDTLMSVQEIEKMLKKIDFKDIINLNIRLLQLYGIIVPECTSWETRAWYVWKAIIFLGISYVCMLASEMINMILVLGDLEKMTEASFLTLTHLVQATKLFYIFKYSNKLNVLINNISRKEFQPWSYEQYKTLRKYIQESKMIFKTFLSAGVVTCCFWGLNPFTDGGDLCLPLAGWYPFDTDSSPVFEITFAYQFVGSMVNASSNISIDTLMSGLIMVVCAQLNILNDSLRNLRKYAEVEVGENNEREGEEVSLELQRKMDEKLVECVVHHRYILEFASEITFLFTNSILGQFIVSVVIICITLFEITLLPWGSLKFFSLILYQFCMLLEIFLLCYYGNEVILQSMELTKFAYCSDWIYCSTEFKRNLSFFMTRSQMPLKLYAGGFFTLSLETFVKILKSSWSYFAVLNRVHSRDI